MDPLARIERKINLLLHRKQQKDWREPKRQAERVARLKKRIQQLKIEKMALLKYIHELEGFLKVQREGDKDV